MYQAVRQAAFMSVARGCGFGGLAILTAMMGFAGQPSGALKFGGLATLLTAAILLLKAWRAPDVPYKQTEIWLLLAEEHRPLEPYAQGLITAARVEALYRFAFLCAVLAAIFLTGGLIAGALLPA